jgi:hypothetical protein
MRSGAPPTDVISFSGDNSQRTNDNLYDLAIDRMLLNSQTVCPFR